MRHTRRVALAVVAVAFCALTATAQAAPSTYRITDVRTKADRAKVARTGAAIVQVDHGSVVVTASRSDRRALRRAGFRIVSAGRTTDFPSADGAYHNYNEMTAETAAAVSANPSLVSRTTIGTSYEGRQLWAVKVSDNVGTDESEPEVLFTAGQHAREHLTVEMALYILNELTSKYASDAQVKSLVDTREIWIVPNVNPDGAEYDIATGTYRVLAQEPPAQQRLERGRHRPQPQLGVPVGLLRRLVRHVLLGDLPRPVGVLGPGDPARARLRRLARGRRRAADQGAHRLAHLLRADPVAVRLHDGQHDAHAQRRRSAGVRDARSEHGRDQRLHARAVERPLHRRRDDQRLAVGDARDLLVHVRDVPAHVEPGLLPAGLGDLARGHPQPRGADAVPRGRRLPVRGHRQAVPVLRRRAAGRGLRRRLRGRARVDGQPRRHRHGHHRRVSSAPTPRTPTRAAPSSSARRRAARTTS